MQQMKNDSNNNDIQREKHAIQMQMVILESDIKKAGARKMQLENELRSLKMQSERIRIEMDNKNKELDRITLEWEQNQVELKKMQKKFNILH